MLPVREKPKGFKVTHLNSQELCAQKSLLPSASPFILCCFFSQSYVIAMLPCFLLLLLACSSAPSLPPSALYLGESSPARSESHYSLQLQPTCVLCSMQAPAAAQWKGLTAPCLHFWIQDLICFAARQWSLWNAQTKARLSVFWGFIFFFLSFFCCFCSWCLGCIMSNNSFAAKYWKGWVKALQRLSLCNRWIICCSGGDKSGTPPCSHKYNVYLLWL